jgi:hypothetical protein
MAGVSCTVRNTIFVLGKIHRISRAAARPFITGILISMRTISGFNVPQGVAFSPQVEIPPQVLDGLGRRSPLK